MTATVTASAPSKLNAILRCGHPDGDGYHALFTVFFTLDLREVVCLTPRPDGRVTVCDIFLDEDGTRLPTPPQMCGLEPARHLAVRAVELLRGRFGVGAGADLVVEKRVPVAGGMAGGSADAAAALVAANAAFGLGLPLAELARLGRELGADVPACVLGGVTMGTGRGDVLVPVEGVAPRKFVAVTNHEGLSTPEVFRQADAHPENLASQLPTTLDAEQLAVLRATALGPFAGLLENDLQGPALELRPDLAEILDALSGALPGSRALLSGSGPTIIAPILSDADAVKARAALGKIGGVSRVLRVAGPGAPARLETEF